MTRIQPRERESPNGVPAPDESADRKRGTRIRSGSLERTVNGQAAPCPRRPAPGAAVNLGIRLRNGILNVSRRAPE